MYTSFCDRSVKVSKYIYFFISSFLEQNHVAGPWSKLGKHKDRAWVWTDPNQAPKMHEAIRRYFVDERREGGCSCLSFPEVTELVLHGNERRPSRRTSDSLDNSEQVRDENTKETLEGVRVAGWGPLLDWRNNVVAELRKHVDQMQVFTQSELKTANEGQTDGSGGHAGGRGGGRVVKSGRSFHGCDGRGSKNKRKKVST